MYRGIILLFFFLIGPLLSRAQDAYFSTGLGGTYTLFDDEGLSDLPYEGGGIQYFNAVEWEGKSAYKKIALRMQAGLLSPVKKNGTGIHSLLDVTYRQLYHNACPASPWQLNFGPVASLYVNQVLQSSYANNVIHPFWDLTVGVAARAVRPFYLMKRKWDFILNAELPLAGLALRPDYAYAAPRGFYIFPEEPIKAIKESLVKVYPPKLLRIKTSVELDYIIKNGNRIGLAYQWEFGALKGTANDRINPARAAGHGILFYLKFNF